MEAPHLLDEPEWTIDAGGGGGFVVTCSCGWEASGFDTASLARAAGEEHRLGRDAPSRSSPAAPEPGSRRAWFRRRG